MYAPKTVLTDSNCQKKAEPFNQFKQFCQYWEPKPPELVATLMCIVQGHCMATLVSVNKQVFI